MLIFNPVNFSISGCFNQFYQCYDTYIFHWGLECAYLGSKHTVCLLLAVSLPNPCDTSSHDYRHRCSFFARRHWGTADTRTSDLGFVQIRNYCLKKGHYYLDLKWNIGRLLIWIFSPYWCYAQTQHVPLTLRSIEKICHTTCIWTAVKGIWAYFYW